MEAHLFQFALLLGVLGLAAVVSFGLGVSVVPLYIGAGVLLGQFVEPDQVVTFMGSLGITFLLFSLGLEFSVDSVIRDPRPFLRAGSVDLVICFPVGLLLGRAFGWTWSESLYLAGILYMTSSAVVAKCLVDLRRAANPETETVLQVMVFEDLVIAVYMVALATLVAPLGVGESTDGIGLALARSLGFVGLLVVLAARFHRPIERLLARHSEESFILVLFSFILLVASAGIACGLSESIGAFLAGLVVGATGLKERAARTLYPFQTLFAALFFVAFGMEIEIERFGTVAWVGALLVAVGLVTKPVAGYLAGRLAGHRPRPAFEVGLALVPKGEFSIVLAGLAAQVARPEIQLPALAALYVFALSVLGPLGMRESDRLWSLVERLRPRRPPPDHAADGEPSRLGSD